MKRGGTLVEEVYRIGGKYDREIRVIVRHLEAAIAVAPPPMAAALQALVTFYRTGEDADRAAYDIAWVHDKDSPVDTINGFVEVYMDPRGIKGSWEALVYYVNRHKTENIRKIAAAAQWFEDHMPWNPEYRKDGVRGITASAIDVVVEAGESAPMTPVGINLPNDQAIRDERLGVYALGNLDHAEVRHAAALAGLEQTRAPAAVDRPGRAPTRQRRRLPAWTARTC